tara:strand:- start:44 stop:358 length:315 start_codon:yes stop_codon:yes gene_type:complete
MSNLLKVCDINEIPVDTLLRKSIRGSSIILIKKNNSVYAIENQCSHMNYPLSDGELNQYEIECIYHGAKFDIRNGEPTSLPATENIRTYEVVIKEEEVFICIDE